jgi:hypothetical protein
MEGVIRKFTIWMAMEVHGDRNVVVGRGIYVRLINYYNLFRRGTFGLEV